MDAGSDTGWDAPGIPHRAPKDALLVTKLARYLPLPARDRSALSHALSLDVRNVKVRSALNPSGGRSNKLAVILSGWACCYCQLRDGRLHLVAFYLPGDVCDLHSLAAPRPSTTIILLPGARIARLSQERLTSLGNEHPAIGRTLWLDAQVASSIEREWMVSLALRSARERVAHLLCELLHRLEAVGQLVEERIELPISQLEFAGACGLTPAHANRTLRRLQVDGLVSWAGHTVTINDRAKLADVAGFSPAYLKPSIPDPARG